jgi:hypothetical protein
MSDDTASAPPLTRKAIEAKIVARAWQDDAFRKKFIADPKGQFEEKLGTKLADTLTISVHEEDANSLHFVIPMKPAGDLTELSDQDLERVAGGTDVVTTAMTVVAAYLITTAVSVTLKVDDWS